MKALIVSYSFPPVGGAGVQRMSKLVRYLPSHGVTPAVLTVENPSVPLRDDSLSHDLPRDLEIVRARTFEPGYAVKQAAWSASDGRKPTPMRRAIGALSATAKSVLVPDPQILWQPAAQLALSRRLAARRDDVVLISGPPFSQFLAAPLIAARRKVGRGSVGRGSVGRGSVGRGSVGLVLDYRDEWSTYRTSYEMTASAMARMLGDALEPAVLRCAQRITTATDEFRDELLRRFPFLSAEQVVTIPNGYDPADFPAELPAPPSDRFVLTYAGTVFKLTSAQGLLGAVRLLHERDPELARLLSVQFIGRIVDTERGYFEGSEALGVRQLGYVPHNQVLPSLSASHLTLCLLDEVPGVERIYPAKIFELMHLRRPVLTLSPEGALTRLVRRHELGEVIAPRDQSAIADALARHLRAFRDGAHRLTSAPRDVEQYDRRALAGRFADVMRAAAADAR